MHQSVMDWVAGIVPTLGLVDGDDVLEVGSYNVNGSVRPLFAGCRYLGIDVRPGRGVDLVCRLDQDHYDLGHFRAIVCTEVLEHATDPIGLVRQMTGHLAPGGDLLLTARGFDRRGCFPIHEEPLDLWRFSLDAMVLMVTRADLVVLDVRPDPAAPGWFIHAQR